MRISKRRFKIAAVMAIVLLMSGLIAGTAFAMSSPSGWSECHKLTPTELVCSGAVAEYICNTGEYAVWHLEFSGPAWSLIFVEDDNVGGKLWGSFPTKDWCTKNDPPFQPAVQPLEDEGLMSTPALDGRLPCGLFDLNSTLPSTGHGYKTAYVPGWPGCPQDGHQLDMLCMDDVGGWVTPEFSDIITREDGLEVTWTSHRDGVCGFFSK